MGSNWNWQLGLGDKEARLVGHWDGMGWMEKAGRGLQQPGLMEGGPGPGLELDALSSFPS